MTPALPTNVSTFVLTSSVARPLGSVEQTRERRVLRPITGLAARKADAIARAR